MTNEGCPCTSGTCPPCMGRCGCAFQKAQDGAPIAFLLVIAAVVIGLLAAFFRKLLRRRPIQA